MVGNSAVTSCDGSSKYGSYINIDFSKINRSCTCIITSSFIGDLLVASLTVTHVCATQIKIGDGFIFVCPSTVSSQTIGVQINESMDVRAEYVSPFTSGTFYHCLGFQQNGKYALVYLSVTAFPPNFK